MEALLIVPGNTAADAKVTVIQEKRGNIQCESAELELKKLNATYYPGLKRYLDFLIQV